MRFYFSAWLFECNEMKLMIWWCLVAAIIHSAFICPGIQVTKINTDPPAAKC
jgi:hypothetical protein